MDLKIRALVEGLANVTKLSEELLGTGKAAKAAASESEIAAKQTEDAYKTLGIRSFAEIKAEIEKTKAAYARLADGGKLSSDELANATTAVKSKLSDLNRELEGSSKSALDSFTQINTPIGTLKDNVGKLVGAFTALAVAYGLKESADYAARTETLGVTLNVVAKNAGYSGEQIAKYEGEVRAMGITTQAARQSLTQMIQAGLPLGPVAEGGASSISKLARAAQDLAVVTGENSSATLTRLITNIQQMDTEGLRYMGLTVNIEAAQQKFALSIGKTSNQLTQQQKTQAVLNEAMLQADKLSGAYAASMETVGKKVQSLKRYQEDLADDVGKKLLPSYGALVDSVTAFLKAADASVKGVDQNSTAAHALADGVKEFFDGVGDVLLKIVDLGGEIFPVVAAVSGQVLSLLGDIIRAAAAVATFGGNIDTANGKVSVLGAVINAVGTAIGILIAGLRDGFTLLVTSVQYALGVIIGTNGLVLESVGKVVRFFNKDLGDAMIAAGQEARKFGAHLRNVAADTVEDFGKGKSALGEFNKALGDSAELTKALGKASTYKDIEEQIRKLLEAKRENTKTDKELKDGTDQVGAAVKRLGDNGDLTAAQMGKLNADLGKITSDSRGLFIKAIDDMGLSLDKVGGTEHLQPLNKEMGKTSGGLSALAENANTTAGVFQEAFAKGLDTAKSVSDINAIAASLELARKNGLALGDANQLLTARFEEVFAASLKAANTRADYQLLEDQVREVGKAGTVSGDLIKLALEQIADKAKGASEEIARMGKQAVDAAQAAVNIGRAHLDLVRADADVGRARIAVWQAQNKYAKDGSDLAAQELQYAQTNLKLAQAKAEQARLHYAQEQQAMTVLISQQKELNALARLKLDLGNEALIAAAAAAKKEVEGAQQAFDITKQKALKQQEIVMTLEEQAVKQKLLVDQAKASADEAKRFSDHTRDAAGHAGTLSTRTGDVTKGMMSAAGAAGTLADNLGRAADQQYRLSQAQSLGDGGMAERNANVKSNTGENKTYADKQQDFSNSAEENHLWDFKEGKGGLTEADRGYVEANWQAAQANLATMQANSGAYSSNGMASALQKYNEARRAMEALGSGGAGLRGVGDSGSGGFATPGSGDAGGFAAMSNQLLDQIRQTGSSSGISLPAGTVQSVASQSSGKASKVIQVNFTNDSGQSVPVTVDAANEGALLALLQKAKGIAS